MSRNVLWTIATVLTVLALTSVALAAGEGHGHGSDKGIDFRTEPGLWTLLVFAILVFILSRTAWPAIVEGLTKREAGLISTRDEATRLRNEAAKLRDQFKQDAASAQDQVRELLEEARRDAVKTAEAIIARAHEEATADQARAKREIETARDQVMMELYRQSIELATLASAKVIRQELTAHPQEHARLVEEALVELKQAAGGPAAPEAKV
jgi:F-type H+-transporting ATPase subunit b